MRLFSILIKALNSENSKQYEVAKGEELKEERQ
jgi:hypothetical protein